LTNNRFFIIDEVSMLNAATLETINERLSMVTRRQDKFYGGINMIFIGDFLQMPTVLINGDVYLPIQGGGTRKPPKKRKKDEQPTETTQLSELSQQNGKTEKVTGFRLWRSLNSAVILTEQMRQADDVEWGECLSRIRTRCPTDEDVALLKSRIRASIRKDRVGKAVAIVRRNNVREAFNQKRLELAAKRRRTQITYCLADVLEANKVSVDEIYRITSRRDDADGDSVLGLIPGAPIMLTKNLDLERGLVNGATGRFLQFSYPDEVFASPAQTHESIYPPSFMLVDFDGLIARIEPVEYTVQLGKGKKTRRSCKLRQFPITLAYAISDYKCQGTVNLHRQLTET
jgi:PIF1-like helicase